MTEIESQDIPFVKVCVGDRYFTYCCPRCASVDLTEKFYPSVIP